MAEEGRPKQPATRAGAGKSAAPPSPRRVRATLDTIGGVTRELARLYREARGGKVDPGDASKMANMLALLGRLIEGSDLEKRIAEVEKHQSKEINSWSQRRH